jgi:hypothetical protein
MAVVAANTPADSSVAEPPRLALNLRERRSVVDDQVVACVFAERHEYAEPETPKRQHDGQCRAITDVFRMLHALHLGRRLGWAVSKTDNRGFAYDEGAPE